MSPSSRKLDAKWQFSQVVSAPHFENVKEEWLDCAIPTSVHVELKKAGRIPDPFKGLTEWDVQCENSSHYGLFGLDHPPMQYRL
jgi:beta-mannosidase